METTLCIRDNFESLVTGQKTLADIKCDIPLTCELYLSLHDDLQATGINIQQSLPSIIKLFDPSITLPANISNLTRKVRKIVEKAQREENEAQAFNTIACNSEKKLSDEFAKKNITTQVLLTCSFSDSQDNTIDLEIKHILEL